MVKEFTIAMNRQVRGSNKGLIIEESLEVFNAIQSSAEVASIINQIRSTTSADERRQLKAALPYRCPHYFRFKDNRRAQDCIIPEEFTFQTCVDIDREDQVEGAIARAYLINNEESNQWYQHLLRVEKSASGKVHFDIRLPLGMTIREAQQSYCEALGVEFDESCCSPERMIYITDKASELYVSEHWQEHLGDDELKLRREAYLNRGLTIDGRETEVPTAQVVTMPEGPSDGVYPADYQGIPYPELAEELAQQLGGSPAHGSRNNFIFSMACHLRHVCDDDPKWIASVMPDFGEDAQRVNDTILSACRRNQSPAMSQKMKAAIDVCLKHKQMDEAQVKSLDVEPAFPTRLPAPLRLLVSKAPRYYWPSISTMVFPALAMRMGGVKFRYWDNTFHEVTTMAIQAARTSVGKSCVKAPINAITKDIEEKDREAREKEQAWKDAMNTKGANKERPVRPDGLCIQVVDSDMTNAAFTQRLADAEKAGNKGLYSYMDEIEMINKVAGGGKEMTSRLICRNFDTDHYGQERVGAQSVTARTLMRWNIAANTTPNSLVKFLGKHTTDGTLARINLCTIIPPEDSDEMPIFGIYDDRFQAKLNPYLKLLDEAKGTIDCKKAREMAANLCKRARERAALMDDEGYKILSYRAAVIAFRKACILYVMNGMKWSEDIETFCTWAFDYDLWCKMRFFGNAMSNDLKCEMLCVSHVAPNMLDQLPDTFSRDELADLRQAQGKERNPRNQLAQWVRRQFIQRDELTGLYHKTQNYLSRHAA